MLVLLSFVLLLVAAVLLVLGVLVSGGEIAFIYVSIGMSAVAAVLLFVAMRSSKPALSTAGGPTPLEPEPAPERELVGVGAASSVVAAAPSMPTPSVAPPAAAPEPTPALAVAPPGASEGPLASDADWGAADEGWEVEELDFPIADYDELTVSEVLPLLPQLYSDELDVVDARERAGLNRREVLDKLAELRITGTDADREVAAEGDEPDEPDEPDERVPEEEPVVPVPAPAPDTAPGPIAGYDDMSVSEIVALLARLDDASLDAVRAHEAVNKNRRTVLTAIDRRLGVVAPATAPPTRAAVAARKAVASPVATTSVAPAPKKAAPARKATALVKKAAAKKAPPAKKAAAKKAPAKRAAAEKAPVKKAAPAKKTTAKKAAPAKKATAAKAAPAKKATAPAKKAAAKKR